MPYEDRFVCFIDILGFAQLVKTTYGADAQVDEAKVLEVANVLQVIRHVMDVDRPDRLIPSQITQMFSDSIVFSFAATERGGLFTALLQILWLQQSLAWRGFLARGAIARGGVVHTKEMLFGPAFLEAYEREQKAANYPRVILDDDIIEAGSHAHAHHHDKMTEAEHITNLLARDLDGVWYVDYIAKGMSEFDKPEVDYSVYLAMIHGTVHQGLSNASLAVRMKYQWLSNKLPPPAR